MSDPAPDWPRLRADIAGGATPAAAAARAGVTLAALEAQFRAEGWPLGPEPAPAKAAAADELARNMLAAAHAALATGDILAVERAARAVERLLKAEGLLAAREAADQASALAEGRAEALRRAEDRLFELVEEEVARRLGARPDALPLWRRFNRPDRAPQTEEEASSAEGAPDAAAAETPYEP